MQEGSTLGHYRILERLGAGGMGEVYAAEDTRLGRKVALKTLRPDMAADPERRARFEREARAVAALDHPNIVTIYSVEDLNGLQFFTMELVKGQPLSRIVRENGLPLGELLPIAVTLAGAVGAAHEQGITHRDLKPDNVLVGADGRLKVLDFGVAKLKETPAGGDGEDHTAEDLTQDGKLLGTVSYMSPEQAEGKPVDPRSDVFALGILIYELATGQRPFVGDSKAARISAVLRDTPPALSELNPDLPETLTRIVDRCLAKDPAERYPSAVELRDALETVAQPPASEPTASMGPESTSRGRRWWVAVIVATTVLGAAMGLGVLLRDEPPADPQPDSGRTMIAVLPFENLGPAEDAYFAAGMTEAITSRLAAVSMLGVISRSSAADYDRTGKSMRQTGADLGVAYVLDGTVQWAPSDGGPGRVRITPQLIRVLDDTYVWSKAYDRVTDDLFGVQSEIAEQVTRQLDITLLDPERRALLIRPTENLEAYQAYVVGLGHAAEWLEQDLRLAVQMFERALDLDPEFALSHARLSTAHSDLYRLGHDRSDSRLEQARESALQALAIRPRLPEGHLALGQYFAHGLHDDERAMDELTLASQGLPNDSEVKFNIAMIRRRQGRFDDAVAGFRSAAELDPLSFEPAMQLARTYTYLRRYAEAGPYYDQALSRAPDRGALYWVRAHNLVLWRGEIEAALGSLERMPSGSDPWALFIRFQGAWLARDFEGALAETRRSPHEIVPTPWALYPTALLRASVYRAAGDSESARREYELAGDVLERESDRRPGDTRMFLARGLVLAGLGRDEDAVREGLRGVELHPVSQDAFVDGTARVETMAEIYTMVGQPDSAIDRLEYLLSIPSFVSAAMLRIDPRWDALRGHPGFERLLSSEEGSSAGPTD